MTNRTGRPRIVALPDAAPKPTAAIISTDALATLGCTVAPCGLVLPTVLSLDAWEAIGRELVHQQQSTLQWRIGDWWNYPGHRYGERTAVVEADNWDGPSASTCAKAGTVAKAFETSRRREVLSFKHHAEVAHLSPPEAERLLDWCEEPLAATGKLRSTRELREEIKRRMARRVEKMEAAAYPSPLAEPRVVTLRVERPPPKEYELRLQVEDVELPGPKVLHLEQPPSSPPGVPASAAAARMPYYRWERFDVYGNGDGTFHVAVVVGDGGYV